MKLNEPIIKPIMIKLNESFSDDDENNLIDLSDVPLKQVEKPASAAAAT